MLKNLDMVEQRIKDLESILSQKGAKRGQLSSSMEDQEGGFFETLIGSISSSLYPSKKSSRNYNCSACREFGLPERIYKGHKKNFNECPVKNGTAASLLQEISSYSPQIPERGVSPSLNVQKSATPSHQSNRLGRSQEMLPTKNNTAQNNSQQRGANANVNEGNISGTKAAPKSSSSFLSFFSSSNSQPKSNSKVQPPTLLPKQDVQVQRNQNAKVDYPELRGVDRKFQELILNEVVEHKPNVKWNDISQTYFSLYKISYFKLTQKKRVLRTQKGIFFGMKGISLKSLVFLLIITYVLIEK